MAETDLKRTINAYYLAISIFVVVFILAIFSLFSQSAKAASFNDVAGDDEQFELNVWYSSDSL